MAETPGRVTIRISIMGVDTVVKNINGSIKATEDLRQPFNKIAEDFRNTEFKVFQAQGGYGSRSKWTALSPKYKKWKSQRFPGKPILQQTGSLRNSLSKKGAGYFEVIRKQTLTMGSTNKTFKWHQQGTSKMPKRPPITITKYQGTKWAKIVGDHIRQGVNK